MTGQEGVALHPLTPASDAAHDYEHFPIYSQTQIRIAADNRSDMPDDSRGVFTEPRTHCPAGTFDIPAVQRTTPSAEAAATPPS